MIEVLVHPANQGPNRMEIADYIRSYRYLTCVGADLIREED